jgi:hypothetical protein
MLGIIIPFRARAMADDWAHHTWLLARTLESVFAGGSGLRVVVVCHDIPDIPANDRLAFLTTDIPLPMRNNCDMCADKAVKLSIGSKWAIERGCDQIMFTDADDLVSRHTLQFAMRRPTENGWYVYDQYRHAYGSPLVRKENYTYPGAGSSVIVRAGLLHFASPPFEGDWFELIRHDEADYCRFLASRGRSVNTLAAVGHMKFIRLLELEGTPIAPFPMPAKVLINHSRSLSHVPLFGAPPTKDHRPAWRRYAGMVKRRAKLLPGIRPVTRRIREDFSLPAPTEIPLAFRSLGTVFEC